MQRLPNVGAGHALPFDMLKGERDVKYDVLTRIYEGNTSLKGLSPGAKNAYSFRLSCRVDHVSLVLDGIAVQVVCPGLCWGVCGYLPL